MCWQESLTLVEPPKVHIVRKDRFHKLFPDVADSDVVIKCELRGLRFRPLIVQLIFCIICIN